MRVIPDINHMPPITRELKFNFEAMLAMVEILNDDYGEHCGHADEKRKLLDYWRHRNVGDNPCGPSLEAYSRWRKTQRAKRKAERC